MDTSIATSNVNRAYSRGTSIALFTFTLFFLYSKSASGEVNALLFQVALIVMSAATLSFLFAFLHYYCSSLSSGMDDDQRALYSRRGDRFWPLSHTLLFLDPSPILFTVGLRAVGSV